MKNSEIVQKLSLSITRQTMLEIAHREINAHYLTKHSTYDQVMADPKTSGAMIGFMKCWELLRIQKSICLNDLLEYLETTRRVHYECEDGWYSCPKSEYGETSDPENGKDCICGADD